ncbi:right-handed parallel beta-helix repeat-containing protein [Marisediminicola senii]|uniref:right-handed parallel beta-helix repeat-containing protein n=1 Tax=Marisediminicola senii TaxID=2711233 RepID=UPI0013ECC3F0|nr:right-handed parallel beta-helix repeat-containing protein [Marisediminicola senii]
MLVVPPPGGAFAAAAPAAVSVSIGQPTVVVPTGGSASVAIAGVPAGAASITLRFEARGAWRDTAVTATLGSGDRTGVLTARLNQRPTATMTLPVPGGYAGRLTMSSERASVEMRTTVVGYSMPAPAPAPAPAAAPAQVRPAAPATPATPARPAGQPNAATTGVPAGTPLTVHNGTLTVTTPGAVISALDIRGDVIVKAANVTIRNSIVRGTPSTGVMALVNNLGGHANLRVVDTEIAPSDPSPAMQGVYGYNFTLTRVNLHHVVDSVHLTGGNVVIEDSWLHDNLHFASDPFQGGSASHDDSIQIQTGSNVRITGNAISGARNAAVMITQDRGPVSNVTIAGNWIGGGACSINMVQKSHGPLRGISVTGNTFARDTRIGGCAVVSPSTTPIAMSGNVWVGDGAPVAASRG